MSTIKLYQNDVYQKEGTSKVISVSKSEKGWEAIFDQTIFFPEGGGQSGDDGEIIVNGKTIKVLDTKERDGEIYHLLESEVLVGSEIQMKLNWAHRFDNMQRHSGEHIVSGAFYELFGGINRGFHMGDDHMTIDISLEDEKKVDELTWEMCLEAERWANERIYENLPVIRKHFDTKEEANKYPMRKKLAIEKDITLVGIGSWDYDWGTVACCGTHPERTGEVGLIKFYKMEINKGMYRIYLEAGKRAFKKYEDQFESLTTLGRRFSAGPDDILDKYEVAEKKQKEKADQLYKLKKAFLEKEKEEIVPLFSSEEMPVVKKYSILTLDDLNELSKLLLPSIKTVCFLVHEPSNTVLLLSNEKTERNSKYDVGKLVKDNVAVYNGKGGGSQNMARAILDRSDYVDLFIDMIEKLLR